MPAKTYKYLKFTRSKDIAPWHVGYYINNDSIDSKYPLVPLRKLIAPQKKLIKKDNYDGTLPIVEKIVFKTGRVVFREKNETGMDMYALKQNDLLVSNINFHQGATALNTFGDIAASTHYQPYKINVGIVYPEYLTLVLRSSTFLSVVSRKKAQGIKNESGYSFIGSFSCPLPSLSKQQELVKAYNDKVQHAEISDNQAEQLESKIEEYLLNELRISYNSAKLHKGLNFIGFRNVNRWDCYNNKIMGESTVFQNTTLSQVILSKPQYGAGYSSKEYDGETRYIRITDINEDGSLTDEKVSAVGFLERYLLKENDFLIARSGNTVGKTFLYSKEYGKAIFAGYLIKFELDTEKIAPKYLLYYTKCSVYKNWINSNMRVFAQPNINSQQYLNSPVVLPPIDIQNAIVEHIKKQKKQIMALKQQAEVLRKEALEEFEKEIFK